MKSWTGGWLQLMLFAFIILNSPYSILSAAPFVDNGDGTVTDSATNLRWQKCSGGQTNNATCSGTAGTYTWQNALSYCASTLVLAGKIWRLPSLNELKSLADQSKSSPAIDTAYFPATGSGYYWTSTTYAPSVNVAWIVYFYDGSVSLNSKTNSTYVRCVSAGP